jgi:hypothetical protein
LKKKSISIFISSVSILILFSFALACGSSSGATNEQSKEIEAFVGSQMVVEEQLKSPSTAKFPLFTDDKVNVTKISENKYNVSAYVDSENSFGAMVRTYYTCTVILLPNDKYRVENLKFLD